MKFFFLGLYGFFGMLGWYNFSTLQLHQTSVVQYDNFSPEMTISHVRSIVWYHSRGKLQELRAILNDENLLDEERVKIRITNMLKHRTSAYIRDMNGWNTPILKLGNWYQDHFDFNNFLDDVFKVVFDNSYPVNEKIRYVTDIMEEYQNMTTLELMKELNK